MARQRSAARQQPRTKGVARLAICFFASIGRALPCPITESNLQADGPGACSGFLNNPKIGLLCRTAEDLYCPFVDIERCRVSLID